MLPKGRAGPVDGVARFCGWRPKKGALSGCEIVKWTHEGLGVSDVGAMDCPPDVKHGFGHLQCGHNCRVTDVRDIRTGSRAFAGPGGSTGTSPTGQRLGSLGDTGPQWMPAGTGDLGAP